MFVDTLRVALNISKFLDESYLYLQVPLHIYLYQTVQVKVKRNMTCARSYHLRGVFIVPKITKTYHNLGK